MNVNPITKNDVVKYLAQVLNIDIHSPLVLEDMLGDLKSIHDLNAFRIYIKENFTESEYQYLTGYQKFLALVEDFKKENKPRLSTDQKFKADSYTETLFKKTVDVFDLINWEIQIGKELYSKEISFKLFKVFGEEPKDLQVLERIGKRPELLRLVRNNKELLREKINKIVMDLTLKKHYPQLTKKTSQQKVLENLSKRAAS